MIRDFSFSESRRLFFGCPVKALQTFAANSATPAFSPPRCGVAKKTRPRVEAFRHRYLGFTVASTKACLTRRPPKEWATNTRGLWASCSFRRRFLSLSHRLIAWLGTWALDALLSMLELYEKRRILADGSSWRRRSTGQKTLASPLRYVQVSRAWFSKPLGLSPCTKTTSTSGCWGSTIASNHSMIHRSST